MEFYPQHSRTKEGIFLSRKAHVSPPTHILSNQGDLLAVRQGSRSQVTCMEGEKSNPCPTDLITWAFMYILFLFDPFLFGDVSADMPVDFKACARSVRKLPHRPMPLHNVTVKAPCCSNFRKCDLRGWHVNWWLKMKRKVSRVIKYVKGKRLKKKRHEHVKACR